MDEIVVIGAGEQAEIVYEYFTHRAGLPRNKESYGARAVVYDQDLVELPA